MSAIRIQRLLRRLLVLTVLLSALAFLSADFANRTAYAATCCSQCDPQLEACYQSCGDPPFGACLTFCQNRYNRCVNTCDPEC